VVDWIVARCDEQRCQVAPAGATFAQKWLQAKVRGSKTFEVAPNPKVAPWEKNSKKCMEMT